MQKKIVAPELQNNKIKAIIPCLQANSLVLGTSLSGLLYLHEVLPAAQILTCHSKIILWGTNAETSHELWDFFFHKP